MGERHMSEGTQERNPAQDLATAQHLDHDRRWAGRFGDEDFQDRTSRAYDRHVERVGYDPLDEQDEQR